MSDAIKISEEAASPIPQELRDRAAKAIIILPEDWTAAVHIYASTTESLAKLFRKESTPVEVLDAGGPLTLRDNRSADWFGPTFFVSSMLLTEDPNAVSVALGVVSSYVYDFFKGSKTDPTVRISLAHENSMTGEVSRVRYEGPVSGLTELSKIASKWAPNQK